MSCGEVLGIIRNNEGRALLWDKNWLPPPGDIAVETAWLPHCEQNLVTMVGQVLSHYSPALPASYRLHIALFHPMSLVLPPSASSSEAMGIAPGSFGDYCSQCSSAPSSLSAQTRRSHRPFFPPFLFPWLLCYFSHRWVPGEGDFTKEIAATKQCVFPQDITAERHPFRRGALRWDRILFIRGEESRVSFCICVQSGRTYSSLWTCAPANFDPLAHISFYHYPWIETCPVQSELYQLYSRLHLYQPIRALFGPIRTVQFVNFIDIKLGTWAETFSIKDSLLFVLVEHNLSYQISVSWATTPLAQINAFIFITV